MYVADSFILIAISFISIAENRSYIGSYVDLAVEMAFPGGRQTTPTQHTDQKNTSTTMAAAEPLRHFQLSTPRRVD